MDQLRQESNDGLWSAQHEIIVIGSGYGGSIASSRLARADKGVTVLERGREIHPGEFPYEEETALRNLQTSPLGASISDPRNLYWLHLGNNMNVLSGCGLGGTSLINANVSLEPDSAILEDPRWPEALRADRASLATGFRRAREMLQPEQYPSSYPRLNKVDALRQAGAGQSFMMVPVNVRFQGGLNAVGVEQEPCTCCGDCVSGCNVGAKNTLLMNYLPDAVTHHAKIYTEIDVDRIERASDGGWKVYARSLDPGRWKDDGPNLRPISAKYVVLAAGTMGSTGILLRSREKLALSSTLGTRFTGNGDVLGFALDARMPIDGVGEGPHDLDPKRLPGPCITAAITHRPGPDSEPTMLIEDAVIPGVLARAVITILAAESLSRWVGRLSHGRLTHLPFVGNLLRRGPWHSLERTQTYLLMGDDDGQGVMELEEGGVEVRWPDIGSSAYYRKANAVLKQLSKNVGGRGTYLHDVIWSRTLGRKLITVHPLGGCVMGDDVTEGVVDHAGRVFDAGDDADRSAVHSGLYVWDGSIVPRPLGVNPLLTISALAERGAALMAEEHGWTIKYKLPTLVSRTKAPSPPTIPGPVGALGLAESMAGFWSTSTVGGDVPADFATPAARGEQGGQRIEFHVTLSAPDVEAIISDPAAAMDVRGTVTWNEGAKKTQGTVDAGEFRLSVPVTGAPNTFRMEYRLPVKTNAGHYLLTGFKLIQPGVIEDVWRDTTTLYVTMSHNGNPVGLGKMTLSPQDFVRELGTMKVTGRLSHLRRLELLAAFGEKFAGELFHEYGHLIHPSTPMKRDGPPRMRRPLDVPRGETYEFSTADGVNLRLTRYNGGERSGNPRATVVLSHGMGANPLTFSMDTIKPNLLEFLVGHGYDVWLQEWRGSTLLPEASTASFNGDQVAEFDHPATHRRVSEIAGTDEIHWITHCVGSMTFLMSAMAGYVRPASLICSSAGAHPVASLPIRLRTRAHLAEILKDSGIRRLTTDSFRNESFWQWVFDRVVRLNWIPEDERCDEAVCHRLEFIYGVATHHEAIDAVTHHALHELFGVTNLEMLSHLSEMARKQRLVDARGRDRYLPHLDRLQFPITFLHGERNLVWLPESSEDTFTRLVERYGSHNYERHTFPEHGHQDLMMGASAWRDAFPKVLEHLERWR